MAVETGDAQVLRDARARAGRLIERLTEDRRGVEAARVEQNVRDEGLAALETAIEAAGRLARVLDESNAGGEHGNDHD